MKNDDALTLSHLRDASMPQSVEQQVAVLLERTEVLVLSVDELKDLVKLVAQLQRDQEHTTGDLRELKRTVEERAPIIHMVDKRLVVIERWHKFMVAIPAVTLTIILSLAAFTKGYVDSISAFRDDTRQRLSTIEFTINSPNFKRAMGITDTQSKNDPSD